MSKSVGKVFENNFKESVPEHIWYYRPPDSAQGFDVGASSKLRFSQRSPCDCMLFNGEYLFCFELKSVSGNSISFERTKEDKGIIHKYQIDSLFRFSKYKNVISGFLLDFRGTDKTYFLDIKDFLHMISQISKKSFHEKDLLRYCTPVEIEKKKMRVNYRYNVDCMINKIVKERCHK